MPRISVVVPVYNIEIYLKRSVDSILEQTFVGFEAILIDDGSKDFSAQISDEYVSIDSRIIVIHQKNQGVSVARNNGIEYSRGKYITFIDSDDWVTSQFLDRLYRACQDSRSQMAVCDIKQVKDAVNEKPLAEANIVLSNVDAIEKLGTSMDTRFRGPVAKLIDVSVVKKHLFPNDRRYAEDAACTYLWMYDCDRIVLIPEVHYYYYQRDDSTVHIDYDWHRLDAYSTFEEMLNFFSEHDMDKPFRSCLCKYLHEMTDGYERCILLNRLEIAEAIQTNLRKVVKRRLNVSELREYKNREELLPELKKFNSFLYERYLTDCCYGLYVLYNQLDSDYCKQIIKNRLVRIIKQYHPPLDSFTYVYEIAFPQKMKMYWLNKALFRKLKGERIDAN